MVVVECIKYEVDSVSQILARQKMWIYHFLLILILYIFSLILILPQKYYFFQTCNLQCIRCINIVRMSPFFLALSAFFFYLPSLLVYYVCPLPQPKSLYLTVLSFFSITVSICSFSDIEPCIVFSFFDSPNLFIHRHQIIDCLFFCCHSLGDRQALCLLMYVCHYCLPVCLSGWVEILQLKIHFCYHYKIIIMLRENFLV